MPQSRLVAALHHELGAAGKPSEFSVLSPCGGFRGYGYVIRSAGENSFGCCAAMIKAAKVLTFRRLKLANEWGQNEEAIYDYDPAAALNGPMSFDQQWLRRAVPRNGIHYV